MFYFLLWISTSTLLLQYSLVSSGWFSSESEEDERSNSPIVLWWTPFTGEAGSWKTCGEHACFFTENRTYLNDPLTKVVVFYGSSFSPFDLPLPKPPDQEWALLHEESPKNNPSFCYEQLISLFNYTSTWSRFSHFPLTLLNLPKLSDITDKKYYVPIEKKNELQVLENLSPIIYVQSSCDAPLERDAYIQELQKYISIDSYGKCLNNKQLPAHLEDPADAMHHSDFLRLTAQYKFTLAFENAVGDDYITEKLWRPLTVGSIPVYLGSPSVQDWAPNNDSIISVLDYPSPELLAARLLNLNADDEAYSRFMRHKTHNLVDNDRLIRSMKDRSWSAHIDPEDFDSQNFVEAFECFLCAEASRRKADENQGYSTNRRAPADDRHFSCPPPVHPVSRRENPDNWWVGHWYHALAEARAVHQLVLENRNYTAQEFHHQVVRLLNMIP